MNSSINGNRFHGMPTHALGAAHVTSLTRVSQTDVNIILENLEKAQSGYITQNGGWVHTTSLPLNQDAHTD